MEDKKYFEITKSQLDKIGNTIIYLQDKIGTLNKTKILKLLYILDEISIKRSGIPFLNLKYKTWTYGPVSQEIFTDLSNEITLLKDYIKNNNSNFENVQEFNDDEFSENDIKIMDYVIREFGSNNATELVKYTHRDNSPWHIAAKSNDVLELFNNETITTTDIFLDMASLISHDKRKLEIYKDYLEFH